MIFDAVVVLSIVSLTVVVSFIESALVIDVMVLAVVVERGSSLTVVSSVIDVAWVVDVMISAQVSSWMSGIGRAAEPVYPSIFLAQVLSRISGFSLGSTSGGWGLLSSRMLVG